MHTHTHTQESGNKITFASSLLFTLCFRLNVCGVFRARGVGDAADGMYFIENGSVSIRIEQENGEVEISVLGKGQYFGELALVTHRARAASAYAASENVKVACKYPAASPPPPHSNIHHFSIFIHTQAPILSINLKHSLEFSFDFSFSFCKKLLLLLFENIK